MHVRNQTINPDRSIPVTELVISPFSLVIAHNIGRLFFPIFNTVAFRHIEDKIMPRCTHKGCAKEFDVANDTEEVCIYHPGAPVSVLHRYLFT